MRRLRAGVGILATGAVLTGCAGGGSGWGAYDHTRIRSCSTSWSSSSYECRPFGTCTYGGGVEDLGWLGLWVGIGAAAEALSQDR